jgi:diguanylate cyclase (GGDEF)-like protein
MKLTIEKLKKEIERLKKLVYEDELTKLFNRRGFLKLADPIFKEIRFVKLNPNKRKNLKINNLSLILLDIDNFKKINDTYGHLIGDKVLVLVASIIKNRLREIDLVGRYGGEEIIILLLGANKKSAYSIAEEIREKIASSPLKLNNKNKNLTVTASLGVAELTKEKTLEELIKKADQAMYKAKNLGKNKTIIAN